MNDITNPVQHQCFPNIYAVVVGIDVYKSSRIRNLRYARSDARAIYDLLRFQLHVPDTNISLLEDENATRQAILDAIQLTSQLIVNATGLETQILDSTRTLTQDVPCLFIYFAGHGASSRHTVNAGEFEIICPYDIDLHEEGFLQKKQWTSGIADYEIQALVNDMSKVERNNNIFLCFDCCHSAGLNRYQEPDGIRRIENPAWLTKYVAVPRGSATLMESRGTNHESHVLLAACSKTQSAKECIHLEHGWLTSALLELLKSVPVQSLTYETLIENIKVQCPSCVGTSKRAILTLQTPHCDGKHVDRYLFSTATRKSRVRGEKDGIGWRIPRGSIVGVLLNSTFAIYGRERCYPDNENPEKGSDDRLGELTVTHVEPDSCILNRCPTICTFDVPDIFYAEQISLFAHFTVFSNMPDRLDCHYPVVKRQTFGIEFLEDEETADIRVYFETGSNQIRLLRGKQQPEYRYLSDCDEIFVGSSEYLENLLRGASVFYHHLKRNGHPCFQDISAELSHVQLVSDRYTRALGENEIALTAQVEPYFGSQPMLKTTLYCQESFQGNPGSIWTKPVGLKLSGSSQNLYPYVFVFNPSSLSIKAWNCIARTADGQFAPDPYLISRSHLNIGWEGNETPWGFYLNDDQEVDVAFIKIFLFEKPVPGLADIEQEPIKDGRAMVDCKKSVNWIPPALRPWCARTIAVESRKRRRAEGETGI